jgi:hypothetical protein
VEDVIDGGGRKGDLFCTLSQKLAIMHYAYMVVNFTVKY